MIYEEEDFEEPIFALPSTLGEAINVFDISITYNPYAPSQDLSFNSSSVISMVDSIQWEAEDPLLRL